MRPSRVKARPAPAADWERRKPPGAPGSRVRKKRKRLDAICDRPDVPVGSPPPHRSPIGGAPAEPDDPALLRRSSRVRRAPVILDSSPVPSPRKRPKRGKRDAALEGIGGVSMRSGGKRNGGPSVDSKVKEEIVFEEEAGEASAATGLSEKEAAGWCSRLRSRVGKGQGSYLFGAGKRKLSYRQSDEPYGEDKDLYKPRKEVMDNLDSIASKSSGKEMRKLRRSRRRRKLKERDGAPQLFKDKGKCRHSKAIEEEETVVLSCSDNDSEKNVREYEDGSAAEASVEGEGKVIEEKTFPDSKTEIKYEEASSQDESKIVARGIPEDGRVTSEKDVPEDNGKITHEGAALHDESKLAAGGDVAGGIRATGEKALSEGKHKITCEQASSQDASIIASRGDMLGDGRVMSEKTLSESSEYLGKISPEKLFQEDKDKTTEKASLEVDNRIVAGKASADGGNKHALNSVLDTDHRNLVAEYHTHEIREVKCADKSGGNTSHFVREKIVNIPCQSENGVIDQYVDIQIDDLETRVSERHNIQKQDNSMRTHQVDALDRPRVREGRRCGLCGGGSDGKPPKKLILESPDSDNEPYNGSSSSDEPTYDLWDGFGDEPEWLGRLLGPIRDRFGIARVWVHQQCAVWSPEVYFAGLGHLKSVSAALCRGRALKCSHCGRPGATIGCRVDRCPKTYHLPCARAENCTFDHRKFLIACTDHRHIFQPQGNHYLRQLKKRKTRKMRLDTRKVSNDAWREDLEAEEKWLENCGEDEEFLKREGKRLHRDMSRIAPVYIGGSCSDKEKPYQGWESVAGLQGVIQCMKEVIILPLLYPELFSSLGLTPPRGVLLHGYPGTGKTLVVRALIGECSRGDKRIAYFARKGADCLGKYVGDAERQLRLLFQVAERCQPSIIFFDEIDGLAPCRSKQQDQTHNSVVSTLLSLLDGLKSRGSVVVIGATNRPDAVDPALRRPGRFDREIYFPLPSVKDRSAILSLQTKNWPKPLSGPVLSWIANQTAGYAGADLQALCTQAAMIALKRNCPLHEILTSAEKGSSDRMHSSLPSFTVEERDWLAALACASPPCSQREAGMAANGVVTAPLPTHLLPCLLQPLSYILISFYFDERIWMPPALFKASKSIKDVINSALQQVGMPITSWKSHLHHLIQKSDIAKDIERNLACFGLLNGASPLVPFYTMGNDNDNEHAQFDSDRLQVPHAYIHHLTRPNISIGLGKPSGFRVLIAGTPRSGQQHLAACLLHQFLGHIEIQKVNLATITQEGRGDVIRGITQILLKCVSVGRCMVYMPRLDLWAVDEVIQQDTEKSTCPETNRSSRRGDHDNAAKHSSPTWDSFVEQLDSMSSSSSIIVLASCEMENHDLPAGIREFFTTSVLNGTDSTSVEHTIPRFSVQVDGNFNHSLVISSSIARISCDLVQQYVQMIHQRSHMSNEHEKLDACYNMKVIEERKTTELDRTEAVDEIRTTTDLERLSSNHGASSRDNHAQQLVNGHEGQHLISKVNREDDVPSQCHQDSLSRVPSNKVMKGNSMFMIAALGYQILQYPQFAELCWATSKLKEGPCADINGPWRVWPFNSCIVHTNNSTDKAEFPLNSGNVKDKENTDVVRGLIAVGLLAYRGAFTSVSEVSFEVRKVLELLVRLIRVKIQNGKDRYRFLRLLSQVPYLEDMVNSWAYTYRSLPIDSRSQMSSSNSRLMISVEMDENGNANAGKLAADDASMPSSCGKSFDFILEMAHRKSPQIRAAQNGEHGNQSNAMVPDSEAPSEMLSSAPLPLGSCPDFANNLPCNSKNHVPCSFSCKEGEPSRSATSLPMKQSTLLVANLHDVGQAVSDDCGCRNVSDQCNGLGAVAPSNSDSLIAEEQVGDAASDHRRNVNLSSLSETICLYDVCADCLQSLHDLTQEILTSCLESNGHSPTVDDVHDIVTVCSVNLVAAVRKHFFSQSFTKFEEFCSRKQQGSQSDDCSCQDIAGIKLKKRSHNPKRFEHMRFFPNECSWHLREKEVNKIGGTIYKNSRKKRGKAVSSMEKIAYNNAPIRPALRLLFRDGALLPSNPPEGVVLHCNFEKLCIHSIVGMIPSISMPQV